MKIWELLEQQAHRITGVQSTLGPRSASSASQCRAACRAVLSTCRCDRRQKAKRAPVAKKPQWPSPPKPPKKKKQPKRSLRGYIKPRAPTKPRAPIKPSGSVAPPKPRKWT